MAITTSAHRLLAEIADHLTPWPQAETALAEITRQRVYLGGDGLRPYACWTDAGHVHLAGVQPDVLPPPPLVKDALCGAYGPPVISRDPADLRRYSITVPVTNALSARLTVPAALLIGLGDTDRYRGARLPLGVARLAQWLAPVHPLRSR